MAALLALSIALFLFTSIYLLYSSQKTSTDIEAVKSQLRSAKSAVVNFSTPDYSIAIMVSAASLALGIAIGFFLPAYFREEK